MITTGSLAALGDTLAEYEQRRNAATLADYQQNVARARFDPFPDDVSRTGSLA